MGMNRVWGMMSNVRNFPTYLLHKWGIVNTEPFMLRACGGVSVEVPKRMMHTAKEVFFADDYQLDVIASRLGDKTASPVIVDVGANVGYLSAFCFTRFPTARVISIEPLPKNLSLLERNRALNPARNWTVVAGVLAQQSGTVEIRFDDDDSYSTSASLFGLDVGPDRLSVPSFTLNEIMDDFGLTTVHILKLDCEGAEYPILYGLDDAILSRISYITMETHEVDTADNNNRSMVQWLTAKGWQLDVRHSKVLAFNPKRLD